MVGALLLIVLGSVPLVAAHSPGPMPRADPAGATLPGTVGAFSVQLSTSPGDVVAGDRLAITLQIDPLDGPPIALSWSGLPDPCGSSAPSTVTSSPFGFSCAPTATGPYTVDVEATNITGATGNASVSGSVSPSLHVTLSASPSTVTAGKPMSFDYQVTGGLSPYQLVWGNLPSACSGSAPSSISDNNPDSFGCTPSQAMGSGPTQVTLQVSDNAQPADTQSASTQLTVVAQLQVALEVPSGSVSVGSSISIGYQVTGGVSPYTLQWSGLPSGCSSAAPGSASDNNPDRFQCQPTQAGSMQVDLQVTDSASPSNSASAPSQSLTVTSSGNNNGNGNGGNESKGNGGNGNNSSGLSSILSNRTLFLVEIVALIVFALLVITAVSTLVTAITVRRLPRRSELAGRAPTVPCPSCGSPAPSSSKFCPECGKPMAPGKAP
jgi:hypothetical protein